MVQGLEPVIAARYEVGRLLGHGGMADVLAAHDRESGRQVAVKVLRVRGQDATLDNRLLHELLAATRVTHPNLATVLDFGVTAEGHRPFFVMEWLQGTDLARYLSERGHCDPGWFVPLFCDALGALEVVHRCGVVHRDLKPANLFLETPARGPQCLRITDFGIAQIVQSAQASIGAPIVCTPRYTPPECLSGEPATPASDVYQMGLVLAEALLGWPMVPIGGTALAAAAHLHGQLQLPASFAGSAVGQVIRRALARHPNARYASAGEFANAMTRLDHGATAEAVGLNRALTAGRYRC